VTEADNQGIVALVGSGEFLPPIAPTDQALIERLGGTPRVAIVPTASAPDGQATFERWLRLGVGHFAALGCAVEAVRLVSRADADDPELADQIARSNFVYLSGGKPRYLFETLDATRCWKAMRDVFTRGGVIAGCSAGAMVLGSEMVSFPDRSRTVPGFGLAAGVLVMPHFDEYRFDPRVIISVVSPNVAVVGVDGTTALVRSIAGWEVVGRGTVTVFSRGKQRRYQSGEAVDLPWRVP